MKNNNRVTLKDVFEVVNRLEDKMDKRLSVMDSKVDALESFKDNLAGKFIVIIGVFVICLDFFKDWLRKQLHL